VLDEHLFQRPTGGPDVTGELIDHVLEVGQQRNIEIEVLPLTRGVHPGLDGPMQLLETPEARWFAYCEGRGGLFISDPKEASVLQLRYAKLRSQALTPEDSMSMLERMRGAL
jgi:hypothetical protein